jgi:uncharacterized protein YdhG (YjbR/CyaY superfamily)
MKITKSANVDDYISTFPKEIQKLLKQLRAVIKKSAPGAEEYIGYGMPAYKFHGPLVYFNAYKSHIGFYPAPRGIEKFKKELSKYKGSKGTVQFPLDKPLPLSLISRIVAFRKNENLQNFKLKAKNKKAKKE